MTTAIDVATDEALVAEAYERVKGEMAALPVEELQLPNLDVQFAVRTILGSLPELKKLRDRMVKELPAFDVAAFDKLEDYTLALSRAQARFEVATEPQDEMDEVFAEASKHRERLIAIAKGLALSDLFDIRKLDQLKHANGFSNVGQDLQALSAAFEESWAKIEGKVALTLDDVKAASRLGLRLTRLVGLRENGTAVLAEATENRRRAFTLVSRTYDETRSAVAYLRRREGDADTFAPALHQNIGRNRAVQDPNKPATGAAKPPVVAASSGTGASTPPVPPNPAGAALHVVSEKNGGADANPFLSS